MAQKFQPPRTKLTPAAVLDAPALCTHSTEIRSIGPAVVLVIEKEGPLRYVPMVSSESEHRALVEFCRHDPIAHHVVSAFFDAKDAEGDGWLDREEAHHDRLAAGMTLETLRKKAAVAHKAQRKSNASTP